jgi:hypothetical protein
MNTTTTWRSTQLQAQHKEFVIPQEQQLLNFIIENNIKTLRLIGDVDPIYAKNISQHYRSNWHNLGVMVREIDVIRRQEGW